MKYVDPTGHYVIENEGGGGSWTPPDESIKQSDIYLEPAPDQAFRELFTLPYEYPEAGFGNGYEKENQILDDFEKNIGESFGVIPGFAEYEVLASMFIDFLNNVQIEENPIPPLERQRIINQVFYEWNQRFENPNIEYKAAGIDFYEYSRGGARFTNITNTVAETFVGGILTTIDIAAFKGLPVSKSILQPRLPHYEKGDISIMMGVIYNYKPSINSPEACKKTFGRNTFEKLFDREIREVADWVHLMTVEMQVRRGRIIEASWRKASYTHYLPGGINYPASGLWEISTIKN